MLGFLKTTDYLIFYSRSILLFYNYKDTKLTYCGKRELKNRILRPTIAKDEQNNILIEILTVSLTNINSIIITDEENSMENKQIKNDVSSSLDNKFIQGKTKFGFGYNLSKNKIYNKEKENNKIELKKENIKLKII